MSFEHKYIELFSELDLRAKVATLKIDFDIAVAKSITAGGGDQQCWSLLFSGKQRDGSTPAIILCISSILSAIARPHRHQISRKHLPMGASTKMKLNGVDF